MGRTNGSGTPPDEIIKNRYRALKAVEMRRDGYTLQAIADELGFNSTQAVNMAIKRTLDRTTYETVDDLRTTVGERYDGIIKTFLPLAMKGDPDAAHVVLKTEAQRARLFGLDAPVRTEVTGADGGPIEVSDISSIVSRIFAISLPDPGSDEQGAIDVAEGGPRALIEGADAG